ncbi:MAG: hypothetical protein U0Z70_19635 [Thermomicrobiales bacterium]
MVERLKRSRGRRALLAGLAGASLLGGAAGLPGAASAKKKKKRATICRNGQTLSVTKKKKQKHLLPGDTLGACPAPGSTTSHGSTTSTTSTTSGPVCPDVKPTDDLQAAINAATSGSMLRLCAGTFRVTSTLVIEKDLTLAGAGAEETILDGEDQVRVLAVGGARIVTVRDLTITRGFAGGEVRGGGIVNSGDLTLRRVTVSFCDAHKGGGVALFVGSKLTMNENSVVEHNTSRHDGGGILNDGTVTMNEGRFVSGNTAGQGGGGIMSLVGHLTMNGGSFVVENTALGASGGGGIGRFGDNVTLNPGSTVAGNEPDDCDTESGACE